MDEIKVTVGLMEAEEIYVEFKGRYFRYEGSEPSGNGDIVAADELHRFSAEKLGVSETLFVPETPVEHLFRLHDVEIGRNFHWQQKWTQSFRGNLLLRSDGKKITAINIIGLEKYLESVVSSEMNPDAPIELMKAHAVISRSWVMARLLARKGKAASVADGCCESRSDDELIRWYDDTQHEGFDVCGDDHCQRYQGISRVVSGNAKEAVASTRGMVLTFDGKICDARFSKCCGGAFETFENCWEPVHHPYLAEGLDRREDEVAVIPDLTDEETAKSWILGRPDAFCNTTDRPFLRRVLNRYDLPTTDFYRWTVAYSREQLSSVVSEKSGIDFGDIVDIVPMVRGVSGRLVKIKIIGTKRSMTIGKELEIRRLLSASHLYSSAFVVEKGETDGDGLPKSFLIRGAGWGHGVGLCQIGAAAMAERGYKCGDILQHYYPGSKLADCSEFA